MIDLTGLAKELRLDAVFSHLMGMQHKPKHIGEGQRRAAQRLNERRERNAMLPSGERPTRQRDRYIRRLMAKRDRIAARKETSRSMGGTAMRPSWRSYYEAP